MKLVYVSDAIYPYNKGGKEKRLYEMSTRLAAMGHDVHIYCMKWWDGSEKTRVENGVTLHAICRLYPLYAGERRSIKQGLLFGFACFKLFGAKFDLIDVDHIPLFPIFSVWLVCVLKRKRMYATWLEVWGRKYWVEYMGIGGNIAALLELISIQLPYAITVISPHTHELMKQELHRSRRVTVVPCGIDLDHIQAIKPSKVKSDIIFAGRLLSNKNVDVLIKAVARIKKERPTVVCAIIGNGPEENKLKKLTERLGLADNIRFIDFLPEHDDLYAMIKSSKVFAFPSTREGFGIVALEAMACNIPVVTVDVPTNAAKDLITLGKTGSYVKLQRIADALLHWISNKGEFAKEQIAEYDWDQLAHMQVKVYAQ